MAYNERIETLRSSEYPMLRDKVYLDHAGTTLYAKSLVETFSKKMLSNLYGNPHSNSDPAHLSGLAVDSVREQALHFFHADPEHFDLIFTANATAAIKLVAESFRDLALAGSPTGTFWYGYHRDAHTSLVGVREMTRGTHHCFTDDDEVERWLRGKISHTGAHGETGIPSLFAYPGQSNMTGRRLPLSWTASLRRSARPDHQNTYSLLDAAALATTTQLDFSDPDAAPDFTALSFYKIFGFPDLGALIVRKQSGGILTWRKYFGGGTVDGVTVLNEASVIRKTGALHNGLEDGTLPFHNIVALGCAIEVHQNIYGSMRKISDHTAFLSKYLYDGMVELAHLNGRRLCTIYTDPSTSKYGDAKTQGATIAFSLKDVNGNFISHSLVEKLANDNGIYLRAGGLCNPGGIASNLKVAPWQFKRAWSEGYRCSSSDIEIIAGKPMGVVRASLGAMSSLDDVDALLAFLLKAFVDRSKDRISDLGTIWMEKLNDSGIGSSIYDESSSIEGGELPSPINNNTHTAAQTHKIERARRVLGPFKFHAQKKNPVERALKQQPSLTQGALKKLRGLNLSVVNVQVRENGHKTTENSLLRDL